MLAKLALVTLALVLLLDLADLPAAQVVSRPPSNTIYVDTGEQLACPDDLFETKGHLWPTHPCEVPRIPKAATSILGIDVTVSGSALVHLTNTSDQPMTMIGSLTMRYDRWHDSFAWWDWFPGNGSGDFQITAQNPLQPGETRDVLLVWDEAFTNWQDSQVDSWKDGYDWGSFVCYYPVIVNVNGQWLNGSDHEQAHALGAWASLSHGYGQSLHEYAPRGRFRATVRYQ